LRSNAISYVANAILLNLTHSTS